jgi:predicted dienelactone hydrolase
MRLLRILLVAVALVVTVLLLALGLAWVRSAPEPLPDGSESARRLAAGPYAVGRADRVWVDASRPTAAHGDVPRSAERSFEVRIWYPEDAPGPHPLAVYCHGFMGTRGGGTYLAEHLASHGYVVVAGDFPLTHAGTPGGPVLEDLVHQPADVSFWIDRALALESAQRPFAGALDPQRIGVFGLSLGGLTSTLLAFHPDWRDPRVAAAVSIAGPADFLGDRFFEAGRPPFLMIAGSADRLVDHATNAAPLAARLRRGGAVVSIEGATHVGFADVASGPIRVAGDPDALLCALATRAEEAPPTESPFVALVGGAGASAGIVEPASFQPACAKTFDDVMSAGRQQAITTLAVRAFLDAHLAADPARRARAAGFLAETLPAELAGVDYEPGRR